VRKVLQRCAVPGRAGVRAVSRIGSWRPGVVGGDRETIRRRSDLRFTSRRPGPGLSVSLLHGYSPGFDFGGSSPSTTTTRAMSGPPTKAFKLQGLPQGHVAEGPRGTTSASRSRRGCSRIFWVRSFCMPVILGTHTVDVSVLFRRQHLQQCRRDPVRYCIFRSVWSSA
jgi:hypothetical protein